jgi:hypothetical protein
MYAATLGGGGVEVSTNGGTNWTTPTASGLSSTEVYGVAASAGTIYAATGGGVSVLSSGGTTWANYTTANGLGSNLVNAVAFSGGAIYAATANGLSIFPSGASSWANYLAGVSINGVAVAIITNNNGWPIGSIIYAATSAGLSISYNGGANWTTYTMANGLGSNIVNGVAIVAKGVNSPLFTVYAATNGGLSVTN